MISQIDRASNMIGIAWNTLPRGAGLYWEFTAKKVLNEISSNTSIEAQTKRLHDSVKNDLWNGEHNQSYETLDHGMKVNYTALVLAGKIALPLEEDKNRLPESTIINDCEAGSWRTINPSPQIPLWSKDERQLQRLAKQYENNPLFNKVKSQIEESWRNRQFKDPNFDYLNDALKWDETALVSLYAVYRNIKSLDEAINLKTFTSICDEIHQLMINNKLWGKDNYNHDRVKTARGRKEPRDFEDLTEQMKENYVLLSLATLSAISDYMLLTNPL